jgi:protein SCO1/2
MRLPLLLLLLLLQQPLALRMSAAQPPDLSRIAYEQRLGSPIPRQVMVQDDTGRMLPLADLLDGKPLVIALGYFHCPNLCSTVRASLLDSLQLSGLIAGRDYSLIFLSIDPSETSADAAAAKAEDLQRYPAPGAAANWHFATGSVGSVQAVSEAIGFRARPDATRKTFVHPTGVVFATPAGLVSSYLLGVGYKPTDLRLAVARANSDTIAPAASPVLLFCFDYDPTTGRYSLAIMRLLRLAAAITVVAIAGTIVFARFRERRA